MSAAACSQTGCSGLAPAPELSPYGAPAAATSPCRAFMNKLPLNPNSYLISFLLNLTHTSPAVHLYRVRVSLAAGSPTIMPP